MFRGVVPDRALALDRNREEVHVQLFKDYFDRTNPTYLAKTFHRRFRTARHVFNCIPIGVMGHDDYFICKRDALGKLGFFSYQNCTADARMLLHGVA